MHALQAVKESVDGKQMPIIFSKRSAVDRCRHRGELISYFSATGYP